MEEAFDEEIAWITPAAHASGIGVAAPGRAACLGGRADQNPHRVEPVASRAMSAMPPKAEVNSAH